MNEEQTEQLTDRLINSIDHVAAWVESAESMASEQAPLVADEIVRFGVWSHGAGVAVGVLSIPAAIVLVYVGIVMFRRYDRTRNEACSMLGAFCSVFSVVVFVIGVVMASMNAVSFIKAVAAPRLYILEYLRELI